MIILPLCKHTIFFFFFWSSAKEDLLKNCKAIIAYTTTQNLGLVLPDYISIAKTKGAEHNTKQPRELLTEDHNAKNEGCLIWLSQIHRAQSEKGSIQIFASLSIWPFEYRTMVSTILVRVKTSDPLQSLATVAITDLLVLTAALQLILITSFSGFDQIASFGEGEATIVAVLGVVFLVQLH